MTGNLGGHIAMGLAVSWLTPAENIYKLRACGRGGRKTVDKLELLN